MTEEHLIEASISDRGRWFLREFWSTANPTTMHTEDLSPEELAKQASFESFDYYTPYADVYMEHLRTRFNGRRLVATVDGRRRLNDGIGRSEQESDLAGASSSADADALDSPLRSPGFGDHAKEEERNIALRWGLHVLIGVSVGIVATTLAYAVDMIETYRADTLYRLITGARFRFVGLLLGFIFWVTISIFLVIIAASAVVYFEPAAGGGGISDVMAYLNGVHLSQAMNVKTFVAKAISCACAVGGGLPVGLEAPLIHLGAITGAGVTQGRSRTLGFQTPFFQAFRNNKDRRDFITAGAACGVSAAFGAPIGGLLFVMEEVCSFWDHSASGQIFLASMICFTVTTIINSFIENRRFLGLVSNTASVLFEVNITIPLNLISIIPAIFLGAVLGGLAAVFTKFNLILIKLRRRYLRPFPLRRFLEPIAAVAIFSSLMFLLALISDCRPIKDIGEVNETVHIWGTEKQARLFNDTCTSPDTYSPFGTLTMGTGKNIIRHLFTRQTAAEFPVYYLLLFFIVYFTFACVTTGVAVSGGLVVPSLVIGATFGRLYGLLLWHIGVTEVAVERGYFDKDAWMDPGLFALIGAGAFLAGTSRMTMSICVIMVELSSELHYLLPVMVAVVMAKIVADWISEPLYHQMLHMDSVPYLRAHLLLPEFEQLTAADVMASNVVMLGVREKTEVVLKALRETTHHAFPVVAPVVEQRSASEMGDPLSSGNIIRYKFVGVVTREDVQVYLKLPQMLEYDPLEAKNHAATAGPTAIGNIQGDSDGFGGYIAPCINVINRMTWRQWVAHKTSLFFVTGGVQWEQNWMRSNAATIANNSAVPEATAAVAVEPVANSTYYVDVSRVPPVVDLSLIVNRSPWVIPPFFNLQMTYHTFRMMGLRHMVVVDGDVVSGMITRKDLLVDSLRRRTKELHARIAMGDSPTPSLPPSVSHRGVSPDGRTVEGLTMNNSSGRPVAPPAPLHGSSVLCGGTQETTQQDPFHSGSHQTSSPIMLSATFPQRGEFPFTPVVLDRSASCNSCPERNTLMASAGGPQTSGTSALIADLFSPTDVHRRFSGSRASGGMSEQAPPDLRRASAPASQRHTPVWQGN